MKKLRLACIVLLLLVGLAVGFFALRFLMVENGRMVIKGGRISTRPDVGYRFASWSNGQTEEDLPLLVGLFEKPI